MRLGLVLQPASPPDVWFSLHPLMGWGHMVKTSRIVSVRSALWHKAGERRLVQNICCNLIVSVHGIWSAATLQRGQGS